MSSWSLPGRLPGGILAVLLDDSFIAKICINPSLNMSCWEASRRFPGVSQGFSRNLLGGFTGDLPEGLPSVSCGTHLSLKRCVNGRCWEPSQGSPGNHSGGSWETTQETLGRPPGRPPGRFSRRPPASLVMRIKLKSLCKELSWEPRGSFLGVSRDPSWGRSGAPLAGFLEASREAFRVSLVMRIKLKSFSKFELPGPLLEPSWADPRSLLGALLGASWEASRGISGEASRNGSRDAFD